MTHGKQEVSDVVCAQFGRMVQNLKATHPLSVEHMVRERYKFVPVLLTMYRLFDCTHNIPQFVTEYNAQDYSSDVDDKQMTAFIDLIELAQSTQ